MILRDWEIWYSYSTYFLEEINDLGSVAKSLIQNDLCAVVFSSYHGVIWWKDDEEIKESKLDAKPDKTGNGFKVIFPKGIVGYAREGVYQAINMSFYETKIFDKKYLYEMDYIRGYLEPCYLKNDEYNLHIYPQIKIYSSGPVDISFRIFAPGNDHPIDIESFIKNFVNLYDICFETVEVPPSLMRLFTRSSILGRSKTITDRYKSIKLVKKFNKYINPLGRTIKEEGFTFRAISLDIIGESGPNPIKKLQFLWTIIKASLDYVINQSSADLIYTMKGMNKEKYNLSNRWVGRPSIYIIEFDEQPETSQDVVKYFGKDLGKILSRISGSYQYFDEFLEPNLRALDDYSVYINEALTLWVYSKKGLKIWGSEKEPNHGKLVYEKQIQAESINYLNIRHWQQVENSSTKPVKNESILDKRANILELFDISRKVGQAGETDRFHELAGEKLKWSEMRKQAEENIRLIAEVSDENFRRFGQ